MKTPKQWYDIYLQDEDLNLKKMINQIQIEAYNQALDDILKNTEDIGTVEYIQKLRKK